MRGTRHAKGASLAARDVAQGRLAGALSPVETCGRRPGAIRQSRTGPGRTAAGVGGSRAGIGLDRAIHYDTGGLVMPRCHNTQEE